MSREFPQRPDACEGVPEDDLRELIEEWREAAEYAKDAGNIHEYDGIMGCVDELEVLVEDTHE